MLQTTNKTLYNECISCGIGFGAQFRAIYKTPNGVRLSGIGQHRDCSFDFVIPTDQDATEHTMDDDYIEISRSTNILGKSSFVFHEAFLFHTVCWDLLTEHFAPGGLNLDRLFEVCNMEPRWRRSTGSSMDPTKIPSVQLLMRSGRRIPDNGTDGILWRDKPATDLFARLPLEIREEIAGFLSTADFLNLRLASRGMAIIFDNTGFWKARFYPNEERGFLFWLLALQRNNSRYRRMDWRLLYHATNRARVGGNKFRIRMHIWNRHRWLHDVYLMTGTDHSSDSLSRTVDIPPDFHQISVSILKEQEATCITGIEFIYRDRPNLNIGYKVPGKSMPVHMSCLNEIEAAVGKDDSVQAIRLVSHTFDSGWLGDTNDGNTRRSRVVAEAEGGIQAMEVRLDGYRMVLLKAA